MTFKEKLKLAYPNKVDPIFSGGCSGCPDSYGYEECSNFCRLNGIGVKRPSNERCTACWNRTIPGTEPKLVRAFETRYLCKWPKENPHLTEQAKAKINAKTILDPNDIDVLERLMSESTFDYIKDDLGNIYNLQKAIYKMSLNSIYGAPKVYIPEIQKVIFNDPATIVIWADGEKTVVKCQNGEPYDPEKGLAMAISKRALGNKHEYYNTFKHWLKKYNANGKTLTIDIGCIGVSAEDAIVNIKTNMKKLKNRGMI